MKSKFIVTGGAGFIGSNLVSELNKRGFSDILIVDHLGKSEKWKNLIGLKYNDYLEKDEFLKIVVSKNYLQDFTHLIHLGACSSTTEKDASYLIRNNFEFSKILVWNCLSSGVLFTYASSAASYGLGEHGYSESISLNKLVPLNMYGYSKHMFDLYLERNSLLEQVTGIKYFNIFGPNEFHKDNMQSMILKGFYQITENQSIRLFQSYKKEYQHGEQKRDFLYIKDAVNMTLHLVLNKCRGIYNIGSGMSHSWNDLAKAIFRSLHLPLSIEYIEMPEALRHKYQYYTKAEIKKIRDIGYKENITPLEESVQRYIKFLLEKPYI